MILLCCFNSDFKTFWPGIAQNLLLQNDGQMGALQFGTKHIHYDISHISQQLDQEGIQRHRIL